MPQGSWSEVQATWHTIARRLISERQVTFTNKTQHKLEKEAAGREEKGVEDKSVMEWAGWCGRDEDLDDVVRGPRT